MYVCVCVCVCVCECVYMLNAPSLCVRAKSSTQSCDLRCPKTCVAFSLVTCLQQRTRLQYVLNKYPNPKPQTTNLEEAEEEASGPGREGAESQR